MNKTLLSAALIAGFGIAAFAPQAANAATGTITFTGKVLSSTCSVATVTGGTVSAGNVAVTLPDVQASAFTGIGNAQGLTPFSLNLTGCPVTPAGVQVGATFSTNIDASTGAITNSGGTSNVEVQLATPAGAGFNLNAQPAFGPVTATISGGTATLAYGAQYYQPTATAVTAGTVSAVVSYTLTYN
ncbi:fimbrial protein [Rhodanobacter panaciterrae]|uniref:Fimbrial protein n=1 Tax=Rhodanobacter panaciterrae TaxID=490572 RepID=A0ABQ3A3U0_9GAMM|nr:fimbrial protein [Rhodanobacter panaciterrae]GGY34487.1 fimbrial protein [Rhodanobacter panaciterrae]